MTPYKALATYLQTTSILNQFTSNMGFYPIQAPQGNNSNYCVFITREDEPDVVHNGGYECGSYIMEFVFYNESLADLDSNVAKFKEIFVGQSMLLDSTIEVAYAETSNEFDAYDEQSKLWIKSLDLSFKYIKK